MSAWKLVEAVPEEPPKEAEPEITTTTRRPSHTSSNRGTSSGRGRGNRSSGGNTLLHVFLDHTDSKFLNRFSTPP